MNVIRAAVRPPGELPEILPPLLDNLSIGRGQIAHDQIQAASAAGGLDLLLVVASEGDRNVAAAVAIHPQGDRPANRSTSATLIHAAPLTPLPPPLRDRSAQRLGEALDRALFDRGVRFVQWASDPDSAGDEWCRAMGFQPIAQLEYLSRQLPVGDPVPPTEIPAIELRTVDWSESSATMDTMTERVERTYAATLDCPDIAKFRTARETVDGYRNSPAFDPELWYEIRVPGELGVCGCLILASHPRSPTSGSVIELVYMGLSPAARRQGLGTALLHSAITIAEKRGAERMILAVDQANEPARRLYRRFGFRVLLSETVSVKSIGGHA